MKIAIGPERNVPSWNWVGVDTARELSKYHEIITFNKKIPACDVLITIKQPLDNQMLAEASKNKSKIIYCPIDFFLTESNIHYNRKFLGKCDKILSHCERLSPILQHHSKSKVEFINHNNKYCLPEMSSYKADGFVLWIGGFQYVAYLLDWLKKNPIKQEIKILSDISCERAIHAASLLAIRLKLKFNFNNGMVNNIQTYEWNEQLQSEMMREAKAAVDIKGGYKDFNQYTKPPTKAQKYIASGIPFAANIESYSSEYFKIRGFNVADPSNQIKWFSKEYWEETYEYGKKLKEETSIESIGHQFNKVIKDVLGDCK